MRRRFNGALRLANSAGTSPRRTVAGRLALRLCASSLSAPAHLLSLTRMVPAYPVAGHSSLVRRVCSPRAFGPGATFF
jgi:hypothetical protein